jgi:hypothetical protein
VGDDLKWSVARLREGLVSMRAELDRMIAALDAGRLHAIDPSSFSPVLGLVAQVAVMLRIEREESKR